MGLGGTGGREELARENLELKARDTFGRSSCFVWLSLFIGTEVQITWQNGATQNYEINWVHVGKY